MESGIKIRPWSPAMGMVNRLLVIAMVLAVTGALAWVVSATVGVLDVSLFVLAFGSCLVSSLAAHVVGEFPKGPEYAMLRMVGSMFARTSLPLAACLVAKLTDIFPFEAGFVFLVLLFYLVGLVVDVSLQARRLSNS